MKIKPVTDAEITSVFAEFKNAIKVANSMNPLYDTINTGRISAMRNGLNAMTSSRRIEGEEMMFLGAGCHTGIMIGLMIAQKRADEYLRPDNASTKGVNG